MVAEFGQLTAKDKVLKSLELSSQGLSRKEVSSLLYDSKSPNSRISALRKLMDRHGYVFDEQLHHYVALPNKDTSTKTNKQKSTSTNKQEPTTTINKPVGKQRKSTLQPDYLTQKDVVALKKIIEEFSSLRDSLEAQKEVSGTMESPLAYSSFKGSLQPTTLQLYSGVWEDLNAFCEKHKTTKKTVVNQAIFDFLRKRDETSRG